MKTTFKVYVGRDMSEHEKFEDAAKVFFREIFKMISEGGLSFQVIETACWIEGVFETPEGKTYRAPLYFCDARDFAWDEGILVRVNETTTIADSVPEISRVKILALYIKSGHEELKKFVQVDKEMAALLADMMMP